MNPIFQHLRIVNAEAMAEYQANTRALYVLQNRDFADYLKKRGAQQQVLSTDRQWPYTMYHSWLPGSIRLSFGAAQVVLDLIKGKSALIDKNREQEVVKILRDIGWCAEVPIDLNALAAKCLVEFGAIQNKAELIEFLDFVRGLQPRVVLEIGTARGGLLYGLSQLAHREALLVSIDLPWGPNGGGQTAVEREVFSSFGSSMQEFRFIPANSLSYVTRETLRRVLQGREIDLLFIDGDHSYGAVRSDFQMYSKFVSNDGVIIFHDISVGPDEWGICNESGLFWSEISRSFKTRMILGSTTELTPSRESVGEYTWGIGVVFKRDLADPASIDLR